MIRVCDIETAEALVALEPDWERLFLRAPSATPFQHPSWLIAWWQAFHPGRLRCLAVWRDHELVGMAALYLEVETSRLLPVGVSLSDVTDFLLDASCENEVLAAIGRALQGDGGWQSLCVPEAPPASNVAKLKPPWTKSEIQPGSARPVLQLAGPGGIDNVPNIKRRKLRMSQHRVERAAGRIVEHTTESAAEFWCHLVRLHASRWKARGTDGVLSEDRTIYFQQAALIAMASRGFTRLLTLEIDGEVSGAYYGFQLGGRAYAYIGGFDPDYAYFSPGTALIGYAMTVAAGSGAHEFDFLRGSERYKYEWGAIDRFNECVTYRRA